MAQILKLLLGGSPCTRWSIAQTKHRETEPSGIGWELFQNYLIAREKYRPDYFLYENNKSMANAIREQITRELGVEPILINSALVSAQNRQRLYWTNIPGVQQPEDRGILLRDVLDDAVAGALLADEPPGAAEVLNVNPSGHGMNGAVMHVNGKSRTITTNKGEGPKIIAPVAPPDGYAMRQVGRRINEQGHRDDYNENLEHVQRYEVNEDPQKTNCLTTVQKDNMVAVTVKKGEGVCVASRGRYTRADGGAEQHFEVRPGGKTNALTTVQKDNMVAQPLEVPETAVNVDAYRFETGENSGKNAVQFLGAFSKDGERWLEDGKNYSRNFNQGRRLHGVDQKSVTVTAQGCGLAGNTGLYAVPVRAGDMPNADGTVSGVQSKRIYAVDGKARTLLAHEGGGNSDTSSPTTGLYAVPASIACRGRNGGHAYEVRGDGKSNAVIVGHESRMVIDNAEKANKVVKLGNLYGQDTRWGIIGTDGKTPTLTASAGMGGGHVPMWPLPTSEKGNCQKNPTSAKQIYEVRDRKITIRGKEFPIKLPDGFYIIRKLTVSECKRLQTVPEDYIFPVSAAQAYKMLGNGWTVDVVAHILSYCPELRTEDVEVLSMYDGMSCGQIALHKLGAHIKKYYATEIDKYAVQTTQANYPATIQLGDAFQVRDADWTLPQCA